MWSVGVKVSRDPLTLGPREKLDRIRKVLKYSANYYSRHGEEERAHELREFAETGTVPALIAYHDKVARDAMALEKGTMH
jgi:hypothetical protein